MISIQTNSKPGSGRNQDRVEFFEDDKGAIVVVADGAGGLAGGDAAADMALRLVKEASLRLLSPALCSKLVADLDLVLAADAAAGECTVVIVVIRNDVVFGASVGDSEAWLVFDRNIADLTTGQYRKPLLGSGLATPVEFGPVPFVGTLVAGTDGLFNYVRRAQIIEAVGCIESRATLAEILTGSAQLPGGGFSDDTTVAVCWTLPKWNLVGLS